LAYVAFNVPHEPLQVPPLELLSSTTVTDIMNLGYSPGDFPPSAARDCTDPMYDVHFGVSVQFFNWMIEAVDKEIEILCTELDTLGRLDDTVIFIVSDNGTARRSLDCPLNWEHAKGSVYQLGARVPMIVWGPRVIAPEDQGSHRDEVISVVDLWTTIAETTGMVDPGQHLQPGRTLDSKSFRYLFDASVPTPPADQRRESALVEMFTGFDPHWFRPAPRFQRAVVHESGYKYVHQDWLNPPPTGNAPEEFLDLPMDPEELTQLAVFTGFTDGASPCMWAPPPPCNPPVPCIPPRIWDNIACDPMQMQIPCDLELFHYIFYQLYVPLYCSFMTSD
jgi:arylsulfatase A-like enzyme